MTTSVIGAGTVGTALAQLFSRAGVPVRIASRRGPASIELGDDLVTPVELAEALEADLVIAAVPFAAVPELGAARPSWHGQVVVDVTNAFGIDPEVFGGRSSAEYNAGFFEGAGFVRGLNHLPYGALVSDVPGADGRRAVFLSGDDRDATAKVAALAEQLGFAPVDLGRLAVGGELLALGGPLLMQNLVLYPL
jgi:predicted dinucleotide-binding enzyme